jgi:hypothetical protein
MDNLKLSVMLQQRNSKAPDAKAPASFPQKEALLFALRELTGKDLGTRFEDWKMLAAPAGRRTQNAGADVANVQRLTAALVKTPVLQQGELMDMYAKNAEPGYDLALARAIPQLPEENQPKARQALVERLSRLPATALRAMLHTDEEELKRAAILACGRANARGLVPDLIACLDHADSEVVWSVRRVLQSLTGQDFGPRLEARGEARAAAIARWRSWWDKQSPK